jgi:hypothetical protein
MLAPVCQVEGCDEPRVQEGRKPQCREHYNEYMRNWWAKRGPAHAKHHNMRKLYGLTGAEYDQLLADQNGVCAICKQPEKQMHTGSGRRQCLTVDHDHQTGVVRGLLCVLCNTMLGRGVDRPEILRAGADYLERAAEKASPLTPDRMT